MDRYLRAVAPEYIGVVGDIALRDFQEREQYIIDTAEPLEEADSIEASTFTCSGSYVTATSITSAISFADVSFSASEVLDWFEFQSLAAAWKENARRHLSRMPGQIDQNYLKIIGMGSRAVPCLLNELRVELALGEPDHWFAALSAITREDPVPEGSRGKIIEMAHAWIAWGIACGYIDDEDMGAGISTTGFVGVQE